ncbi:MAG: division/cell wall cluster transcriptional repressor MraZ [Gemmataceae bacterium]
MAAPETFITGEYSRTLDERYRVALPSELYEALCPDGAEVCILAKEREGCLSLWHEQTWREKVQAGIDLVRQKIVAHRLEGKLAKIQQWGRLLSTRFRDVRLGDRGRLVIPEGFREFLGVEPGGEVILVGAVICVELWHPEKWRTYLRRKMPRFGLLFEELSQ